jgi:hypothetical protein
LPLNLREDATDVKRLKLEASLRDVGTGAPRGMGCTSCIDFHICGGLHLEGGFLHCGELCCGAPDSCTGRMCRFNRADYARRHIEVNGFDFDRIGHGTAKEIPLLPLVAPMIYHGNRRSRPFAAPIVAISLDKLYRHKSGEPRFRSRAELAAEFKIGPATRILVSGIGKDDVVERWWSLSDKRAAIIRNLRDDLGVELVTVPNFSLAVNWPRWCDLHSMKRIALCWHELATSGLSVALHPNGRTEKDFERWTGFIAARPEIRYLSFEFTTGASGPAQSMKYAGKLVELARAAGRPMHLIVMGGYAVWPMLAGAFETLTVLETSIFMKTQHRQRVVPSGSGRMRCERVVTARDEMLDELLAANAAVIGARVLQHARE